jgi:hypothetical protein
MSDEGPLPRPKAQEVDANPRLVAALAAVLALIMALGLLGGRLFIGRTAPAAEASLRGADQLFQHGVQATTDVERSWEEIGRSTPAAAQGYAWVDRSAGIVQVPIGRAIDLVCEEQGAVDRGQVTQHSPP